MKTFNFTSIWNACVEKDDSRPIEPRERLFASELGGSLIDIYLKLRGETPSNPPNARSRRKFNAGNLMEWCVWTVLKQSGVLVAAQKPFVYQYPGLLPVSGRLDFIMGGKPDYEKAAYDVAHMNFPPFIQLAMEETIKNLKEMIGTDELKQIVLEVKSTSSFMLEKYMRTEEPQEGHVLQAFHYLKSSDLSEAKIVYICRDDLQMIEFSVFNPSQIEGYYKGFIDTISGYHYANQMPEKEKEIKFEALRFGTNFKVEYSPFLKRLYGYDEPMFYRDRWGKVVTQFNRTYKRCVQGDKMTALNLATIQEAKKYFPEWDNYVDLGKAHKELLTEEEPTEI